MANKSLKYSFSNSTGPSLTQLGLVEMRISTQLSCVFELNLARLDFLELDGKFFLFLCLLDILNIKNQ